jgi:hypothetical protein
VEIVASIMAVEGVLVSDFEVMKGFTVEDVYRDDVAEIFGVVRTVADVVVTLRKGASRREIIGSLSFEVYVLERLASAWHTLVNTTIHLFSAHTYPLNLIRHYFQLAETQCNKRTELSRTNPLHTHEI